MDLPVDASGPGSPRCRSRRSPGPRRDGPTQARRGRSTFFAVIIRATIPRIVAPRAVWTTLVGRARPTMAPRMAQVEAMRATGMASRQAGQVHSQEPGPCGQGAAEGHKKPCAPNEVQVEGEESAHDGNIENPAPHSSQGCQNPHHEGHDKKGEGPNPPGRGAGLHDGAGLLSPAEGGRGDQEEPRQRLPRSE